jgi:hypothetical protein
VIALRFIKDTYYIPICDPFPSPDSDPFYVCFTGGLVAVKVIEKPSLIRKKTPDNPEGGEGLKELTEGVEDVKVRLV